MIFITLMKQIQTVIAQGEYLIDTYPNISNDEISVFFRLLNNLFNSLKKYNLNEFVLLKIEEIKSIENRLVFPKNKLLSIIFLNDLERFRSKRTVKAFKAGKTYFLINEIIEQLNGLNYHIKNYYEY